MNVEYSLKLGCDGKETEWNHKCRGLKTERIIEENSGIGTRVQTDTQMDRQADKPTDRQGYSLEDQTYQANVFGNHHNHCGLIT